MWNVSVLIELTELLLKMSASLKISFKDFVRHSDDETLLYQPPCKIRKCSDINQDMVNSVVSDFVEKLSTKQEEVFSTIINPSLQHQCQINNSEFHSLNIRVLSKNGWQITTDTEEFTMNIPYEFIRGYAEKLCLTYPHCIAICFYVYLLKKIFGNKYNIQDYECRGPWGVVSGGDGYSVVLYYK